VADRENDRIQVFTQEGKFVREFKGFAPYGLFITPTDDLFVADGRANKAYRMDKQGKISATWGGTGAAPGQLKVPHGITVDPTGAVYVTEINGQRIQKFVLSH
jgi:DNA-binding beta-propeller fold protein YncE